MLVSFTVENFLSFKDKVTLSFLASNKITELKSNYFSYKEDNNILTSLTIFGNNASGKSSLLKAINFGKELILRSTSILPNTNILGVIPFKLDNKTLNNPSFFEFIFIIEEKLYKYNFLLNSSFIIEENLYSKSLNEKKEKLLFTRKNRNITLNNFDDRGIKDNVLANHLALSKFAIENSEEALVINKFFNSIYVFEAGIISNIDTLALLKSDKKNEFKAFLLNLLGMTNSLISDIIYNESEQDISNLPQDIQQFFKQNPQLLNTSNNNMKIKSEKLAFLHQISGNEGFSEFSIFEESFGTQKVFNLAGSLYDVINNGKILFIDEFDSSLSTKIIKHIINVFKKYNNGKSAQIVFTTNNMSLLNIKDIFRRDQIYFTKKQEGNNYTDLFTLQDCKLEKENGELINIRKDLATLEKNYLDGKIKKSK